MKRRTVAIVLAIACSSAAGQVYRCKDPTTGGFVFSQTPCMDAPSVKLMDADPSADRYRDSNTPEYPLDIQRLFSGDRPIDREAREAARKDRESRRFAMLRERHSPAKTQAIGELCASRISDADFNRCMSELARKNSEDGYLSIVNFCVRSARR